MLTKLKEAEYQKEAELARLLNEARGPSRWRCGLALLLDRLVVKLAPEVRSEAQWQGSQRNEANP